MGFPLVNQLAEYTSDGQPDENARNNCVPAAIAAVLEDLTGVHYNGDELKDAVYGQGYTGPTDAARFVDYCAQRGVSWRQIWGTTPSLVQQLHAAVAAGSDGLISIPSSAVADNVGDIRLPAGFSESTPNQAFLAHYAGYSHVCAVAYADADGGLTVMDPWGGRLVALSPALLAGIMVYGNAWVASKAAAVGASPVTQPAQPGTGYYGLLPTISPDMWVCTNGHTLQHGFRLFYISLHGDGGQSATQILGLPISEEYGLSGGRTAQDFERARMIYDPSQGAPWTISCDNIGIQLADAQAQLSDVRQQLSAAQAEVAALKAQPAPAPVPVVVDPNTETYKTAIEALKTALGVA